MANPRKFSEKIAIQKQKQAEETAAFEQIMRDVITATRGSNQHLHINLTVGSCRAESLPDVNRIGSSERGTSIDLKAALNNLDDMRRGRSPVRRHPSPNATCRSPHQHQSNSGHHRTSYNDQRRSGSSPYSTSVYLSPPPMDTNWRRTNSDSALHQTGLLAEQMSNNNQVSPSSSPHHHHQSGTNSPRRSTVHAVDTIVFTSNDPNNTNDSAIESYPSVFPSLSWDPGKRMPGNNSFNANLLSASLPNDSRPKSCEVPGITIHPTPDESNAIHHHTSFSNTGSLPDLTNLHFPAPLSTPIDLDEQTLAQVPDMVNEANVVTSYSNNPSPGSPYDCVPSSPPSTYQTNYTSFGGHPIYTQNTFSPHNNNSNSSTLNSPSATNKTTINAPSNHDHYSAKMLLPNGIDINGNSNHSDGHQHHQHHQHQQHQQQQQQQHSTTIRGCLSSDLGQHKSPDPIKSRINSNSDNHHQPLNQQGLRREPGPNDMESSKIPLNSNNNNINNNNHRSEVFAYLGQQHQNQDYQDYQDVPHHHHHQNFVPQDSSTYQSLSMARHRSTTPSDHSCSAPTSPVSGNISPISSPGLPTNGGGGGSMSKSPFIDNSYHNIHQTTVLQRQLEQFKMVTDHQQDSQDFLLMTENGTTLVTSSNSSSASSSSGGLYVSATNTLAPSQESLIDPVISARDAIDKNNLPNLTSSNMADCNGGGSEAQSSSIFMTSSGENVLIQTSSPLIYSTSVISSSTVQAHHHHQQQQQQHHQPQTQQQQSYPLTSQSVSTATQSNQPQTPSSIPDIILTGADDALMCNQDFAKDIGTAMANMSSSFDPNDLFATDEAFRSSLDPTLDFDELQMMTGFSESASPSDSFRMESS